MKRTAGAFTLLAALGGCMSTQSQPDADHFGRVGHAKEIPGLVGPDGAPVARAADGTAAPVSGLTPTAFRGASETLTPVSFTSTTALAAGATSAKGPAWGGGGGRVLPPPHAGPQGAVAAVGALPGGMPVMGNARSSVRFAGQDGMKVAWLAPLPDGRVGFRQQVEVPGRYNFLQGAVYRLKLSDIPKRPGLELYPTIEIVGQGPKTTTFLAHSAVPLTFTDDDFEQVVSGNFVVKVVYLPDPQFQDLATTGPDEVVSTRLDPGVDPLQEAQRRGSVLLIVRMGNIDLEAPNTPGMDVGNPYLRGPGMMPGGPVGPPPAGPKLIPPATLPPNVIPPKPAGTGTLPPITPLAPMPKSSNSVILP
jgi:hypothetical protein